MKPGEQSNDIVRPIFNFTKQPARCLGGFQRAISADSYTKSRTMNNRRLPSHVRRWTLSSWRVRLLATHDERPQSTDEIANKIAGMPRTGGGNGSTRAAMA